MNARNHYIELLKSSRPVELNLSCPHSAIRRELTEWIILRRYDRVDDDMQAILSKLDIPKEDLTQYLTSCLGIRYNTLRKRLRLDDASCLLLEHPDMPVYAIGQEVGMMDKGNFRRAFEEEYGVHPIEWRRLRAGRGGNVTRTEETD